MNQGQKKKYRTPTLERFGTFRDLTQAGCTAGGDGIWICRTPDEGLQNPGPSGRS